MNILIYGAGSLGLLFARYLSRKHSVEAVSKSSRVNAIRKNGLVFVKDSVRENVELKIYDNVSNIKQKPDFIMLSVKSFDVDRALSDIYNTFNEISVITIQNGVYSEDAAVQIFGKRNIFPAYVMIGSKTLDDNTIEEFLNNGMKIGYLDKQSLRLAEEFNEALNECGITSVVSDTIMKEKWHKMMFYCAGATLNSLTGTRDLEDNNISWIVENILNEIAGVADKLDLGFDVYELKNDVYKFLMGFKPESWSASVGEDLRKCKKTEIDYLNGYIVKLAEQYKTEASYNKLLTSFVKTIEKTKYFAG